MWFWTGGQEQFQEGCYKLLYRDKALSPEFIVSRGLFRSYLEFKSQLQLWCVENYGES